MYKHFLKVDRLLYPPVIFNKRFGLQCGVFPLTRSSVMPRDIMTLFSKCYDSILVILKYYDFIFIE